MFDEAEFQRCKAFFADAVAQPEAEFGYQTWKPQSELIPTSKMTIPDPSISASLPKDRKPGRTILVTVGATASFKALIQEVISDEFLSAIAALGYNRMIVQCGQDYEWFESNRPHPGPQSHGVYISGFDFDHDIRKYMMKCTPSEGNKLRGPDDVEKRGMGLIISHAGSGTMLDALDFNTKLIVVPNSTLMHNHQVELADYYHQTGYLIHATQGKVATGVKYAEEYTPKKWPPQPPKDSIYPGGLEDVICNVSRGVLVVDDEQKREDDSRVRFG